MSRAENVYELPENLPVPIDDGACNHLTGLQLPSVPLLSTAGSLVDLASLPGRTVVYCYPRTGRPDQDLPDGWNLIQEQEDVLHSPVPFATTIKSFSRLG